MITPTISPKKPRSLATKVKKYNLLISIYASQHQAGTALTANIFGPYDNLIECQEAGEEARKEFLGYNGSLFYSCIPTYEKSYF